MTVEERKSARGKKIDYRFKWGQGGMDKMSSGIFMFTHSRNQME